MNAPPPVARDWKIPGDQVLTLVCLVMSGVALLSIGHYPERVFSTEVLGSALSIPIGIRGLAALLLIALTALGMDSLVRRMVGDGPLDLRYSSTFWVLPGLVTLAGVGLLPRQFGQGGEWVVTLVLLSALLAVVVVAECGTVHVDRPYYRVARLSLNLATYAAAFALYASIYGAQWRSLLGSTGIILVTFPLALELLRSTEAHLGTTWLYAGIIAVVAGQISWPLNALGLRALYGGAFLLLVFYTLCGLCQQHLAGRLSRRVALEFLVLAAVFASLVAFSAISQQRLAMTRLPEGVDPAHLGDPAFRPPEGDLRSGPESGSGTDFDPGAP
ncbi:MAG TPA: hypothetical protein PK826_05020 [Anaerolineae bacterium]|nr:hypothetical protein [Anaerolineae bacterium]HRA20641.1 hypothetical protein [Anaerolineae bacterium]